MTTLSSTDSKIFKETIESMNQMGAEMWKITETEIFFFINKDSEFNDVDKLRGCRDFLSTEFGLTLKVKYRK